MYGFIRTRITPMLFAWDCSRDGHNMSEDANWKFCTVCGYTEKK